jgi:hypothetical protein
MDGVRMPLRYSPFGRLERPLKKIGVWIGVAIGIALGIVTGNMVFWGLFGLVLSMLARPQKPGDDGDCAPKA